MKALKFLPLCLIIFLFSNCHKKQATPRGQSSCDTTWQSLFTTFSPSNGYDLYETMDLETHQYKVKINESGKICSVGYENPSTYAGGYTMEIKNITTGETYSGTHTFSQSQIDLQPISNPVTVSNGDIILVKRTILSGYTQLNETLGNVLRPSNFSKVSFPVTSASGKCEYLGSDFYGAGGPVPDFAIPYIVLGFD